MSLEACSNCSAPLVSADADESGCAALLFAAMPSSLPPLSATNVTAKRLSPRAPLPELLLGGDCTPGGWEELPGCGIWPARCMKDRHS